MWELVSSPTRQVTAQEEMASSFARGSIGWILGKSSALQGWSSTSTGCPGKWWII